MPGEWIGPAIEGVSNIASNLINVRSQKNINQQNIDAQKAANEQNRQWALQDWERTNAYNHPAQQMARLREAGLSVQMAMGKGAENTAAIIRGTEAKAARSEAPQIDLRGLGNAFV